MGCGATSLNWEDGESGGLSPKLSHHRVPTEWAEWLCALQFGEGC